MRRDYQVFYLFPALFRCNTLNKIFFMILERISKELYCSLLHISEDSEIVSDGIIVLDMQYYLTFSGLITIIIICCQI